MNVRSDLDGTVHVPSDDAQEARCGRRIVEGETWWATEDPASCEA